MRQTALVSFIFIDTDDVLKDAFNCGDIGALEGPRAQETLHMARRRSKLKDTTWYTKLHINPETSAKLVPESCMLTYNYIAR